jgi:transcription initiation factor TFIIIB Brf1 subunit/transcription initiation factor TFIIB
MCKETIEAEEEKTPQAIDYTTHSLGSYMGPMEYGYDERFASGFSRFTSTFRYLKTISDFAYREGASLYTCSKIIERVCEKLNLPKTATGEAVSIAHDVVETRKKRGKVTIASVSAFAIINACKRLGTTSVGVREVMEAHKNLGYRVKASVIIQLSIDSPIKSRSRTAEEYLGSVLTRLPETLIKTGGMPAGYTHKLLDAARTALEHIDGPTRGGHNPRGLAASAVYAGEMALSEIEERKRVFSQREAAECSAVAEYTVREQYVHIFKPHMASIQNAVRSRAIQMRRQSTETYPIPLVSQSELS